MKFSINSKNNFRSSILNQITVIGMILAISCLNLLSSDNAMQVCEDKRYSQIKLDLNSNINPIDESISKLFSNHNRLPQNFEENSQAKGSAVRACSLLTKGEGVNALPHLFLAEGYFEPGTIHMLIDIINNKYPQISTDICQAIHDRFTKRFQNESSFIWGEKVESLDNLYQIYLKKFTANERNLSNATKKVPLLKSMLLKIDHFFSKGQPVITIDQKSR